MLVSSVNRGCVRCNSSYKDGELGKKSERVCQAQMNLPSKIQIQEGKKLTFLPNFLIFRPLLVETPTFRARLSTSTSLVEKIPQSCVS